MWKKSFACLLCLCLRIPERARVFIEFSFATDRPRVVESRFALLFQRDLLHGVLYIEPHHALFHLSTPVYKYATTTEFLVEAAELTEKKQHKHIRATRARYGYWKLGRYSYDGDSVQRDIPVGGHCKKEEWLNANMKTPSAHAAMLRGSAVGKVAGHSSALLLGSTPTVIAFVFSTVPLTSTHAKQTVTDWLSFRWMAAKLLLSPKPATAALLDNCLMGSSFSFSFVRVLSAVVTCYTHRAEAGAQQRQIANLLARR